MHLQYSASETHEEQHGDSTQKLLSEKLCWGLNVYPLGTCRIFLFGMRLLAINDMEKAEKFPRRLRGEEWRVCIHEALLREIMQYELAERYKKNKNKNFIRPQPEIH